jgi:hypothetical protein
MCDKKKDDSDKDLPIDDELEDGDITSQEIADLIKGIVESVLDEKQEAKGLLGTNVFPREDPRETQDSDQALINTLLEFLNSFAIVGYDFDGIPVCISKTNTIQEQEALNALVYRFSNAIQNNLSDI